MQSVRSLLRAAFLWPEVAAYYLLIIMATPRSLSAVRTAASVAFYWRLLGGADLDDPHARQELFMALWCMKEAVVKAKGTGINAPPGLKGFTVGEHKPWHKHAVLHSQHMHCTARLVRCSLLFYSAWSVAVVAGKKGSLQRDVAKQELHNP
jgi:phosphopantetheinyl transferase